MKKVVLFIVEGSSDMLSIDSIVGRLISGDELRFQIVNGDLTANHSNNLSNILARIYQQVKLSMARYRYRKEDFQEIVHLVDTDGVFIPKKAVTFEDCENPIYTETGIQTKKVDKLQKRNAHKASLLKKLSQTKNINKIPYSVYFFSSNLEHVLHQDANVSPRQKRILADQFMEEYYGKEEEFLKFIKNKEIAAKGTYEQSWEFIEENKNSLKRYSNFHLFFS
ncbi:hypothetical protein FACS189418_8060 [Clostridia bacterium]|nr:hypothetical protein FACS189418_8060 [Clostridia bacterium]